MLELPPLNKLPLTLTPFYPPWQPSSQLILPPLNNFSQGKYFLKSVPIAAHTYMANLVAKEGLIAQKSSHCSPILHGNFSQGR